ncbi:hypothetical protein TIFTF001_020093 [Ficus carica]|uniref:Uncharacterized protein n=1 Tax=Ficus carica TaxID=3494 RepID=A0AA88DDD5_FICCA|nr:hypothetical protein TIFTF001_020093 [Ficus carica]
MVSDDFLFLHSPVSCSSPIAGGSRHRRSCCSIRWVGFGLGLGLGFW